MKNNLQKTYGYDCENSKIINYTCPLDYSALMQTINLFSDRYPFLNISYMGTSLLGRGIPMVSIGDGSRNRRSVLYVGAHHGMEWITSVILLRFINEYAEAVSTGGRICNVNAVRLFHSRTIHVIPQFNVDGVNIQINGAGDSLMRDRLLSMNGGCDNFTKWQANARGVDLNHNYDAGFWEYKRLEAASGIDGGCATRYSGVAPESEPEVASMCNFLRYSSEISMILTLHTQGEEIYYSSGKTTPPRAASIVRLMSRMTGYRVAEPSGMAAYGGLTDWYIREMKKPSFTIECGCGENPLPLEDYHQIYATLRELLFTAPILA